MNRTLLTLTIAGALALGGGTALQAGEHGGPGRGHHRMGMGKGMSIEHMTKELDLTPDQQKQVGSILQETKPQIRAIHQEAMEKSRAVREASMAKIRPLLTAEQQQKLDRVKAAHEKMRDAMKELHEAKAD